MACTSITNNNFQSLVPVIATVKSWALLMASVGESVSNNKRKSMVSEMSQEEVGKSEKKSIALYKFCVFMGWEKIAAEQIFAAFMKSLLCIPHSNASSSEKIFSMVLKIITESKTSLRNNAVCALLSCKLNCDSIAAGFKPFKLQLNATK